MWEQIRSNRMRSVFIVAFMGALLLAVGYIVGIYFLNSPAAGIAIAAVVWVVMNITAYFQGDSILLGVAGARKIQKADHPRLYNVVEEMSIASGLSRVPDVYIIDDPALNAFATGRDPEHASVAITSGLLQKLNRDELQGVIAHEIAHVNNRDILLMSISAVLMGSIVIIAYFASRMMFYGGGARDRRSSSDSGGGGGAIILIIGLVFLILAPVFAQLMYFALSRRREYLADASSALYTRYPAGLASALEKLGASTTQVKTANQATAPMYIVNPFRQEGRAAADLTSTHPPISERIRVLRAMGGASYRDYEQAFEKVKHQSVLGAAALSSAGAVGLRAPSSEGDTAEPDQSQRTRETQDTLYRMNNYKSLNCFNCDTLLRLPPGYNNPLVRCPHCGATNQVP